MRTRPAGGQPKRGRRCAGIGTEDGKAGIVDCDGGIRVIRKPWLLDDDRRRC